jgi:hypothetical protein
LRNRVYEHCDEQIPADRDHLFYLAPRASLQRSRLKSYNLTVVNQQLRREFRPIYMVKTPKWISFRHFTQHIKDFHAAANDFQDSIILSLRSLYKKDAAVEPDILPSLLQISQYPNVLLRFRTLATAHTAASRYGPPPILNKCLSNSDTEEWRQIAAEQTTRIVPRKRTKKGVVYVKQKYKMSGRVKKDFEDDLRRKLGLDGGISWR